MDVAPPYQTAFGGNWLRVFEPRLSLVGWAVWCRWVLWIGPARSWFVSSCQSFLSTGQAEIELFDPSFFSSLLVSPQWSNRLLLTSWQVCCSPPLRLGQLSVLPHSYQTEVDCTLCLWPPVLSREMQSIHHLAELTLDGRWCVVLTCWGYRFSLVKLGQL
jgi:hypothetical protein